MKKYNFYTKSKKPLKRSGFKQKLTIPMKRTRLRLVGHSETSDIKVEIQAMLRQIAILRDKGCILKKYPETGQCGGYTKKGELILQAEHLESRAKSISFADMRNIVCLCRHHHSHWKPQHSKLYWEIIEKHIGKERWSWLKRIEQDKRAYKMDWKLQLLALEQELKQYG